MLITSQASWMIIKRIVMMVVTMTMAMMMLVNGAVVQAVAQPGVVKVDRKWCSPKILLQIDLGRGQQCPLQVYYSGRQGSAEEKPTDVQHCLLYQPSIVFYQASNTYRQFKGLHRSARWYLILIHRSTSTFLVLFFKTRKSTRRS